MSEIPRFPGFKPVEIKDREIIREILWSSRPEISELTFTNLFIWRKHYRFRWSLFKNTLVILAGSGESPFAMQPAGPQSKEAAFLILDYLRSEWKEPAPFLDRTGIETASLFIGNSSYKVDTLRDHFDYVYNTQDLIELPGRKYHSKRNHLTHFTKENPFFTYTPLTETNIAGCLVLSDRWCLTHHCRASLDLCDEWSASREALVNFEKLGLKGGCIIIGDKVEAFSFGEYLNKDTAVIHMEKASTEFPGLYSVINQKFCSEVWNDTLYVNREQDLGDAGLRQAKESYYPEKFVEKFRITLL